MDFYHAAPVLCGAIIVYVLYKRRHTFTISDVPGPKNPSWIYGHTWWWEREEVGVTEKRLLEEYGPVARWNGSLGEERLWIADPKTIHHVLQGSSDMYEKPYIMRERLAAILDRGLSASEGDAHKRQRRAMNPAFGMVETKALYPYFVKCSNCLADKWHEIIGNTGQGQSAIINMHSWLSKVALDAIGAGAFDYDFGAVENSGNKFTESYMNLTFGAFGRPSKRHIFMTDAFKWAPRGLLAWTLDRSKSPGMVRLRENKMYAHEVAERLIKEKKQELKDGTPRRDVLSLLVKANSSLRPDLRLSDEEVVAQVRTLLFAGHETTAKTLTFALWELARKQDIQERLRTEIMETLNRVRTTRGDDDLTVNDFDSMPYLLAVVKEALRVYPAVTEISRASKEDHVLPLSKPITGVSGRVYAELHVPAGVPILISTIGYNLSKDVWGPDAYEFRPERWLDVNEKPGSPVGVYSNLVTFSGGPNSCIGWRFAVLELHTFFVALVKRFAFSLPENGQEIWKQRSASLTPLVVGEEHKGPQLPLKVTIVGNE